MLAGSCSHRLIPGALQSIAWVACSVLPRVEVTIPHCKDQSNKKKYVFTYAQDFTFLSIFLHLQLLTWKISPREDFKMQHSTRKTWGRKPSQSNTRRICNTWWAGRGYVYSCNGRAGHSCSVLVLMGHHFKDLPSSVPQTCLQQPLSSLELATGS